MNTAYYWIAFLPVLLMLAIYVAWTRRDERLSERARAEAIENGLAEPASLHPVIDRNTCIGCKSCVYACPQQLGHRVLGLYRGKAELLEAANCIGHGACKTVCPVGAIKLVFGTETRGVDIPQVGENFETNVPGVFIAGELGGMGLIRNAIEQGKSAMKAIGKQLGKAGKNQYQVVIVGAGPAGIAATLQAQADGIRYLTMDQDSLGGTVFKYPRGKIVMTQPVDLPIAGKMHFQETSKEKLLEYWRGIEQQSGISVNYNEMVTSIDAAGEGFEIVSNRGRYSTDTVLLAIGRRGTPRKLDVPGEDRPKVVYQLIDPGQYRGKRVMIVGGGDSALEAALSIADEEGSEVSLSYRSDSFARAKAKNRERIEAYANEERVRLFLKSNVTRIGEQDIELEQESQSLCFANDAVIVNAGGILPTGFLKKIGIAVETKYGAE